jgi:hypothetical protein
MSARSSKACKGLTGESRIEPPQFILKMNRLPICFMISFRGICRRSVTLGSQHRKIAAHSNLSGFRERSRQIFRLIDSRRDEFLEQGNLDGL